MTSNFETCYVSCGCNKCPHAADWGRNGLICFAVSNSVAIYDPHYTQDSGKILHTLHGHAERINSVRWLRTTSNLPEKALLSTSADGSAIIWSWSENTANYSEEAVLKGHSNVVSIADGLVFISHGEQYIQNRTPLIAATSSIDSTVKIWRRNEGEGIKHIYTIDWYSGFCLDVKFTLLPHSNVVLLACAAHDNCIYLFTEKILSEVDKNGEQHVFEKLYVLVGHDDWIRSLDFTTDSQNNVYLASASQDTFVRVYKISNHTRQITGKVQSFESDDDLKTEIAIVTIKVNQSQYNYAITLETILSGHEGWVYGASWYNPCSTKGEVAHNTNSDGSGDLRDQRIKLLTSSMDKTLIIWSQEGSGVWVEQARLGEVGGNTLGFYGGKFKSNGKMVFGHGYQGSFHLWGFNKLNKLWEPKTVVSGHTAPVMDICWDVKGNYILSVGSDQTTRLHAPWFRKEEMKITWHEMARPQIHGYDMTSVAILTEHKYASGAEEKVIRAFTAPNNFIDNFRRLTRSKFGEDNEKVEEAPQGASVPALGLSNKPVFELMKKEGFIVDDEYPDLYFSPIHLTKPPTEENLLQNTLWPEVQKLYGHGYEIFSLAARPDGIILASSCKATSPEHAAIILWNAKTWLIIQKLISHQLTVTQMAFSPDGQYLLSVSRDRRWSLFIVQDNGKNYDLLSTSGKNNLHSRVIWCCAWTYNSKTFVTGSRDGKIGFWSHISPTESDLMNNVKFVTSLELAKESITALAFAPATTLNFDILAVGMERGVIQLYRYADEICQNLIAVFDGFFGHQLTVKRLAFRPKVGRTGVSEEQPGNMDVIQLASCGADHMLKIYDIYLSSLAE